MATLSLSPLTAVSPIDGRYGGKTEVLSPPFDDYTDLLLSSVPEMKLDWLEDVIANRKMQSGGN